MPNEKVSSAPRSHIMSCVFPPNTAATYTPVSADRLWCDGRVVISKEHSSLLVFRRWNVSPAICAPLFNGAWDQKKQHLSWLQQPLSIYYSSKSSSFGEDWCPHILTKHAGSVWESDWSLGFFFCSWTEGSVWFLREELSDTCPLFPWPEQEPVTQIDLVLLRGCVISRGKIMSIVSLIDIENSLWVKHLNYA